MSKTKIEWLIDKDGKRGMTWNTITGCTPVSEGCTNCYAKRMATRLRGRCGYPSDEPFCVTFHPERLEEPLRWKKPRRIFVCSMSDIFHADVKVEWIDNVLEIIAACPQHTFMILTKRPQNIMDKFYGEAPGRALGGGDYLPNLWLGVTSENQARADERIPILLTIPAAVRFVSVEPMLGPVNLTEIELPSEFNLRPTVPAHINSLSTNDDDHFYNDHAALDQIICGGETGHGARPMELSWARSLRDQCRESGVPFFMKKISGGGQPPDDLMIREFPKQEL